MIRKEEYVITINNFASFFKICTKLMSYVTLIIFAVGNASWILWALHFIYCSSFPTDAYMHSLLLYEKNEQE